MKKLILRLKRSLPTRLLLVFILASICMIALIVGTLMHGFSAQWRYNLRPHLIQYLDYVNTDIGEPPSIERAEELARRLPVNIYINGGGINYSSTGTPLRLDDLEFHHDRNRWRERSSRFRPPKEPHRQQLMFGEHRDRTVLRNQIGEYQVFYEFPHARRAFERDSFIGKALIGLLLILALSYFILRRMLRPVQDIKEGVGRMGKGELNYRVPVRGDNDLGELSASINKMAADIEEMLDAKRQLLLGVSHELRSPLTRAKIAAQMLDPSTNRERLLEDLQEMENLITEILETERMNSAHAALHRSEVDLGLLVRSLVDELPADKLKVSIAQSIPLLQLDEARIRLLMRNLISNALIHGENANPAPSVSIRSLGEDIEIRVKDYGQGIPPEHLSRVTEPFYRADPSRTRATGGFGIGLYLCKLIVHAHGGEMSIMSSQDTGTEVIVKLPVDQYNPEE